MKSIFSNVKFLVFSSFLLVLASADLSAWCNQWHWFGRSGAILTIAGMLLTFRPLVRMGLTTWLQLQSTIDYGNLVPTAEQLEVEQQEKLMHMLLG